jgi:hypothetical protein
MFGLSHVAHRARGDVRAFDNLDYTGAKTHLLQNLLHPAVADWSPRPATIEPAQEQGNALPPTRDRACLEAVFSLATNVGKRVEDQPIRYRNRARLPPLTDDNQGLLAGRSIRIWMKAKKT